jgi:hypothetical protein
MVTFVDSCADLDGGIEGRNLSMYNLCQDVVLDVENLRERFWSTQVRSTLSKILSDTWYRKATLPEDQIFSVLGLVKGTVLQEDYSLSIHDTYLAAARTCILQDRHLGILCLAELSRTPGDIAADLPKRAKLELPSWVPRWGSSGQHIRLRGNPSISGFGTLSRSFGAIRTLLRDPNNLVLQGVAGYLSAAMESRRFVRCPPCKTNQSLHMDQMLLLEHPEDRVEDVFESMAYYYKTGTCHCVGSSGGSTRATHGRATCCSLRPVSFLMGFPSIIGVPDEIGP